MTVKLCNRILEYSFYLLFFFVPLFFLGNTSELFELNKMWLTFALTIIIGVCWISRMIAERRLVVRKTPLDLALGLFLISQVISTIFSLDTHVSLWGYYSRFNGGLFSTLSYIFLYYAFVSNLEVKHVIRVLLISLASGFVTALWGFPSHFGYDPTCLVFRGTLDTNCWTEAFRPTIRVFSSLGQPAWFAAYLDILLPIAMGYTIINARHKTGKNAAVYFILMLLFYICLLFANTRAGTAAFFAIDVLFWIILFAKRIFTVKTLLKYLFVIHISLAVCNFFFGTPFHSFDQFTFPQLQKKLVVHAQTGTSISTRQSAVATSSITNSSQIRLIVWRGAIEAWKASPLFGTGVETFAYAYYQHRPVEHNLTSEWDYLYNKAHNEYLNFLTTTGIFGLGTFLWIAFVFLFIVVRYIFRYKNPLARAPDLWETKRQFLLTVGLLCAYVTILITNFFGFSVVIINIYFFLIPVFVFKITDMLDPQKNYAVAFGGAQSGKHAKNSINAFQWVFIIIALFAAGNMLLGLFRYWYADTLYALGYNLDHASAYQQAYPLLRDAASTVPDEPVYKDEFAVNLATLAEALYKQNQASMASQLAEQAITLDNQVVADHPNNVIFWKNRLRVFYSLANADSQNQNTYIEEVLRALVKAKELAPTDAKISYNLGVFLGQRGRASEAMKILEETVKLKPDYYDAYYALGLLYHDLGVNQTASASSSAQEKTVAGAHIDPQMLQKAVDTYQYVLDNLSPNNAQVKKTLEEWKKE